MIDLGSTVSNAAAARHSWEYAQVWAALLALTALVVDSLVDWEEGDEEWGRVLRKDGRVVGFVCAKFPLGFVSGSEIDARLLPTGMTWVHVDDMSKPIFSIDKGVLENVFGEILSSNVNYDALSAEDIWWATV